MAILFVFVVAAEQRHRLRAVLGARIVLHTQLHHGVRLHSDILCSQGEGTARHQEEAQQAAAPAGKWIAGFFFTAVLSATSPPGRCRLEFWKQIIATELAIRSEIHPILFAVFFTRQENIV